jgi:hypothetical protein
MYKEPKKFITYHSSEFGIPKNMFQDVLHKHQRFHTHKIQIIRHKIKATDHRKCVAFADFMLTGTDDKDDYL